YFLLRAAFSERLPKSRKCRPDFLMRVHIPRSMVSVMTVCFGQPHYQCIADTVNCFFGLPEEKGIAAEHVRDAQRRYEGGGGERPPRFDVRAIDERRRRHPRALALDELYA